MKFFKNEYVKTKASDGTTVYSTKNQFDKTAKEVQKRNTSPDYREKINLETEKYKTLLEQSVKRLNTITKEASNSKKAQEKGVQFNGRMAEMKELKEKIDSYVSKLNKLGVRISKGGLMRGRVMYEGVESMFNLNEINSMKLDVFEENAQGKISADLRDYMLIALERVSDDVKRVESYNEKVQAIIDKKRDDFVTFVKESYNAGLITARQYEVFNEMAEDNFLFEVATPDKLPELVVAYIEAAKEGNEGAKAELKDKIDEAKSLKGDANEEVADDGSDDADGETVTEGCMSIEDTMKELKIKLSPEELELAKKFDKMIEDKCGDKDDDDDDDDDDKDDDKKEKDEDPKDEKEPEVAGGEVKECGTKQECVKKESVEENENSITEKFNSVVLESSLTEDEVEGMKKYITESVEDNVYTEEDKARLERMLNM